MKIFALVSLLVAACSATVLQPICGRDIILNNTASKSVAVLDDSSLHLPSTISALTFCFFVFPLKDILQARNVFLLNFGNDFAASVALSPYGFNYQIRAKQDSIPSAPSSTIPPFNSNEWSHVCLTWASQGGIVKIYVNGTSLWNKTGVQVNETIPVSSSPSFTLGATDFVRLNLSSALRVTWLNGWSRELTAAEVLDESKCASTSSGDIVSWDEASWSFFNGTGIQPTTFQCPNAVANFMNVIKQFFNQLTQSNRKLFIQLILQLFLSISINLCTPLGSLNLEGLVGIIGNLQLGKRDIRTV